MLYPPIDEIIEAAESAGCKPLEIRLGANQMQEFREWAARTGCVSRYTSPGAGAPDKYDGIPVVQMATDNRRSYLNDCGNDVILD